MARCSLIACGLVIARPAAAQDVLYAAEPLDDADRRAVAQAIDAEGTMHLVPLGGAARETLASLAAAHTDRDVSARIRAERERALRAYLRLRVGEAERAWDAALEIRLAHPTTPARAEDVAALLFGRALVRLAARREHEAAVDLATVVSLEPAFSADPDEYGPPVLRALASARDAVRDAPRADFRVRVQPPDADVRLDGQPVATGQGLPVSLGAPHLLTVAAPGYETIARWVVASEAPTEVRLAPARPTVAAAQALARWASDDPPDREAARLAALALGQPRILLARTEGAQVALTLIHAASGETIRTASDARQPWEVRPFAALAAAIVGRPIAPPAPSRVALSVSGPSTAAPGGSIDLAVRLRDPERRASFLRAACGEAEVSQPVHRAGRHVLSLVAPALLGPLPCRVRASDDEGRYLGPVPEPLEVLVVASNDDDTWAWIVGVGAAVLVGAAVAIGAGVAASQRPEQVLRVHVP